MPYADPEAQRDYQRRWVAARRDLFFSEKVCEWCGSADELEIHHRDVTRKENHRIWSWGERRRLAELAKCIVLCRSCHHEAHRQADRIAAELRNPHGTYARYHMGCHCDACRGASREYRRDLRRRKVAA